MKKAALAAVVATSLAFGANASPMDTFTGFVGFGDSLSDKGRNNGFMAPSLGNRFSNGITWMEHLAQEFEQRGQANFNLAVGGATAGNTNGTDPIYSFVDSVTPRDPSNPDDIPLFNLGTFDRQITSFVNAGFDALVGDNPLVALLFGGNDFLQNIQDPAFNPFDIASDVVAGVRRLNELGAEFDDFLVLNLPDLASAPVNAALTDVQKADVTGAVQAFNFGLATGLSALEAELDAKPGVDVNIEVFDLFSANNELLASADTLGLRLDTPCTTSIGSPSQPFNFCPTIESANEFFFVDGVHPNGVVQAEIAARVIPLVEDRLSPVPLPAGLPLLLVGIGALGALRLRRAA